MNEIIKERKFRYILITLISTIIFEVLSLLSIHFSVWIELPILFSIIFFFGKEVFIKGIRSLIKLNLADINLLMTIAVFGALYLNQIEEAAVIIVLSALGDALENYGLEKSQLSLKNLVDKTPKTAQIKDEKEKTPIEEVNIGEIIIVKSGEQIPLDGKAVYGNSLVDEASITGETLPKNIYAEDLVYAGTMNLNGYLEIEVLKKLKDSMISKIVDLIYKSAEKKSKSQKFIEGFARIYTPLIILSAFFVTFIPVVLFKNLFNPWFRQSLTLLIISCPCALIISTPITVFSAIGLASQKGILIKGSKFIEEIGKVKAIAFDKTRTLTKGKPVVSDIIPLNGFTKDEIIACSAGLEMFSEHPIAKSIISEAEEKNLDIHKFENYMNFPGKGVKGECTICFNKPHCIGNIKFIKEEQNVEKEVLIKVGQLEKEGKTAIIICEDKIVKGIIGIMDQIKKESNRAINLITSLKVVPLILTGDNINSAEYVASKVGIDIVKAELLPTDKVDQISDLTKQYGHVAMVGDGINDAPALACANVGISMGAIGSDLAIENADIALLNDNLMLIPYLILLGRKCTQKIRIDVFFAISIKLLFLLLAIFGLGNLVMAIFADVGVTVLIIINGLELYKFKVNFDL